MCDFLKRLQGFTFVYLKLDNKAVPQIKHARKQDAKLLACPLFLNIIGV